MKKIFCKITHFMNINQCVFTHFMNKIEVYPLFEEQQQTIMPPSSARSRCSSPGQHVYGYHKLLQVKFFEDLIEKLCVFAV